MKFRIHQTVYQIDHFRLEIAQLLVVIGECRINCN